MGLNYNGWKTNYEWGEIQTPDLNKSELIKIIERFKPTIFIEDGGTGTMSYIKKRSEKESKYYDGEIIILAKRHIDIDKKEELSGRTLFHELLHLQVWLYYEITEICWWIHRNAPEENAIEQEATKLAKQQPELIDYFNKALEAYHKGPKTFEHFKENESLNVLGVKQKELDL